MYHYMKAWIVSVMIEDDKRITYVIKKERDILKDISFFFSGKMVY